MRLLAVDTTSAFGSIALYEDGRVIEELPMHSPDGFSQTLFASLKGLLRRRDWTIHDIDLFASASGPGSFTGVRVGLTAVKGLAEAVSRPAVAVSNLMALAACGTAPVRAVVADARRGEVYAAVYDSHLNPIAGETVLTFVKWVESLPADVGEIVSPDDFATFRPNFRQPIPVIEQRTLAGAVARIAATMPGGDPAALDANYVRRSDAELNWKDEPVARTS
jgi:tRNA threonylcarbamoyladenosine biosynthesis protein TsaB